MTIKKNSRVVVGLSGGVDSSVAALLLQQQGYDVQGLFMSNWDEDEDGYCTAAADFQDSRRVCDRLGITLHRVDFAETYRERVFDYFLREYESGRTPNPDVLCNREIKFGVFRDYAERLGASHIATGHYARIERDGDALRLLKGLDVSKDQSYFLNAVPEKALRNVLFPVGELKKEIVRQLARDHGLDTHNKKDSTGICFIGERHFRTFLKTYLPARPGIIRSDDGTVLGRHDGLMYYTLGQRQGLGIGGVSDRSEQPWYVAAKDLAKNELLVVQGHEHPMLLSDALIATDVQWIGKPPEDEARLSAKTRYRQQDQSCTIHFCDQGDFELRFETDQRAVTPGQFAVIYDGEHCLGGGVIQSTTRSKSQEPELSAPCRDAV